MWSKQIMKENIYQSGIIIISRELDLRQYFPFCNNPENIDNWACKKNFDPKDPPKVTFCD